MERSIQNFISQVVVDGNSRSDPTTSSIIRYNGKTAEFIDTFVPYGSNGIDNIAGIAFTPNPSVPEPSVTWGLLILGVGGAVSQIKTKIGKRK